jgi:hypothetical protein
MTVGTAAAARGCLPPAALRRLGTWRRTGGPAGTRGPDTHPPERQRGGRSAAGPSAWPGDDRDGDRLDGWHC